MKPEEQLEWDDHLTVGRLLEQLKYLIELDCIDRNTPVVYQRIEDSYFEQDGKNGWSTLPLDNEEGAEVMRAFTCFADRIKGKKVLCVTAFY